MGIKHKNAPIEGVQFHPESILTEGGHHLLANWMESTGDFYAQSKAKEIKDLG
jgi:para-aminobenzoate synthetase component 2